MELDGVRLKLFHKEDKEYDLIETDKAEFDRPPRTFTRTARWSSPWAWPRKARNTAGCSRFTPPECTSTRTPAAPPRIGPRNSSSIKGPARPPAPSTTPTRASLHLRSQAILDWRGKTAVPAHAHRSRRGLLPRARIEGPADAVVQAFARRPENGRRHVDGADGA